MANQPRVAMEIVVRWYTTDPLPNVLKAFKALDASGFPDPATWVSEAIHVGGRAVDPTIARDADVSFTLMTEGPDSWSAIYSPPTDEDEQISDDK